MKPRQKTDKVIRFESQDYHCVAIDSEPWNHPEVGLHMSWLQARLPNLNFTPCRWRFVCTEGVIAAVPIGYFDMRKPDAIPVEIRQKKEWHQQTRPLTEEERKIRSLKPESVMPHKGSERVVEDEYQAVFNYLAARLPNESANVCHEIMDLMKYEAIYENGNRDYFIRVEFCEATMVETALLNQAEQARLKPEKPDVAKAPAPAERYIFRRNGGVWEIRYESTCSVFVTVRKGFDYIHELLANKGNEYSAPELTKIIEKTLSPVVPFQEGKDELHDATGKPQEVIDKKAIGQMVKRLEELRAELDANRENAPLTEIDKKEIEDEIESIQAHLESNTFQGYSKKFHAQGDKERVRITKAIQEATKVVRAHLPELAQYLSLTIKTGNRFYYIGDIQFVL